MINEAALLKAEAERYAEFVALLEKARGHRSGEERSIAPADDAIGLYQVLDSPDWLAPLLEIELPEAHVTRLRETAYELLLLKADHLTRWHTTRSPEDTRRAVECLEKAISFHPPSRGYYWLSANCAHFSGDRQREDQLRQTALETPVHHAAELFYINRDREWGPVSVHRGYAKYSIEESYKDLREMLRFDPTYYNGQFFMAMRLSEAGRHGEGLVAWYGCTLARPSDWAALANRGESHRGLGQYDEAIADLREAIRMKPDYAVNHYRLGNAFGLSDRADEAMAPYNEAIRLDPTYADALHNRGCARWNLGQHEEAIADFREAIRLKPDDAHTHYALGDILEEIGRLEEAVASYSEAIRLNPTLADAVNNLAWLLATCPDAAMRNPQQALELAKKVAELVPADAGNQNTLGVAFYRTGDYQAAADTLAESAQEQKDSFNYFFLAMAQWRLGNEDTAREWYRKAVQWMEEKSPTDPELIQFRAEAEELLEISRGNGIDAPAGEIAGQDANE